MDFMAFIDKDSVRQQIDSIQQEFQKLCDSGKVAQETKAVMQSLLVIVQLFMAIFLEKNTKKTSRNSSVPSSQTSKDETAVSSGTNKKRHANGGSFTNKRQHVSVETITTDFCSNCAEDLSGQAPCDVERRTKIDIIFETVTEHVDVEIKKCPSCETINKGRFPEDMPGPLQYGNGIKAYIINLIITQMVSLNRVQQLVHGLINQMISESTLLKYVLQLYERLERWESEAIQTLILEPSLHVDETSLRVDKKNQWIHVYSAGDTTLKFLHPKRGKAAIEDINIIPVYGGIIIHDFWASYLSYEHCRHGLCGSHLLRELTFVIESNGYRWADNMKKLLKETCKSVATNPEKKLSSTQFAKLQKRYRNIITRGKKELPFLPDKSTTKRGKIAKSDAHNLLERFDNFEAAVLLFAKESSVAFTNNRAERDLRMAKVKQKVSGCFRSAEYAQAYCRISSYLQTMSAKGCNPLAAIQMAFSGEIYQRG
jgi:transposase